MEYGITDAGFIRKPYTVILSEIVAEYKNIYPDFKEHESNLLYIQAQASANREEKFWGVLEAFYYSRYIITATGTALEYRVIDTIGARKSPTYAIGYCKVIATPGTKIPRGTLVKRKDDLVQYRVIKDFISASNEPQDIEVQATTPGTISNALVGEITSLAITILGVQSIYNDAAILGGSDEESDDELKQRYYESLVDVRGSNIPAISARLKMTSVNTFKVRENRYSEEKVIDGITMAPHSIAVTVIGGTDTEIGEALFHTKAGGIDMVGEDSVDVRDPDDPTQTYPILFTRAHGTRLYAKLVVNTNYLFLPQYKNLAIEQLCTYVNSLKISESLDYNLAVAKAFNNVLGLVAVDLFIDRTAEPQAAVDIVAGPHEKFTLNPEDVTFEFSGGIS